jgi:DNA-binding CsgD family transcriptional regulator
MSEQASLDFNDVEAVLRLASLAADPFSTSHAQQRKSELFSGLCQLLEADVWTWITGQVPLEKSHGVATICLLDGGWQSDQERAKGVGLLTHPAFQTAIDEIVREAFLKQRCLTELRRHRIDDQAWQSCPAGQAWREAGFDHFLCSILPRAGGLYSGVRYYRRVGKPAFCERDRSLVALAFENVCWLHPIAASPTSANGALCSLSPRERQVMLLLLEGDSRKEVARKLSLSQHTVADYLKVIYRKLGVCSRGELLAKYLPHEQMQNH